MRFPKIVAAILALALCGFTFPAFRYLTTTGSFSLFAAAACCATPANGFWGLNNTFGTGSLTNGTDYKQAVQVVPATFPNGTVMQWQFPGLPNNCAGCGVFAYGYPLIFYGRGDPAGGCANPFNVVGPWPQTIAANTTLSVTYDITLGGNTNSYDVLLDTYVADASCNLIAEVSFFPYINFIPSGIGSVTCHTFSAPLGEAKVGIQGTQVVVIPTTGGCTAIRAMLAATVNLKEILTYAVSQGFFTTSGVLNGTEFGIEPQVPASFNSGPYSGTMKVNSLSYVWN